jgi:hypothetical protein
MKTTCTALLGVAFAIGLAHAAENPANDCLVGVQDADGTTITTEQICTDGADCDADGATNGTCVFRIRGAINIPNVAGCEPRPIKKVKFVTPASNDEIVITPVAGQPNSVIGAFLDFHVPLKKNGKKPGKRKIIASAKADVKPAGKNKDKDKLKFTCNVCPTADCSDGGNGNVCDNTAGGPDRLVLTIADNGTDLDNGWAGNSFNVPLVPGGKLDMCLTDCDSSTDTLCNARGEIGPGTGSGVQFGAPLPLFANNVPVCVVSRWREAIVGTVDEATGATSIDVKLFSDVYLTDANSVCPQCKNGQCNSGARAGQSCTVEAAQFPVFVSASRTDRYDLSSQCVPNSPTATLNIDFLPLTSGVADPLVGPTPCTRQPGTPIGVPVKPDDCAGSGCGSVCQGPACVAQVPDPTNPGQMICKDSKGGLSQLCCNNNPNKPCHPLANGNLERSGNITAPQPPLPDTTYPKTNTGVLAATFCIPATGTNTIDSVTGLPGPGAILLNGSGVWSKE